MTSKNLKSLLGSVLFFALLIGLWYYVGAPGGDPASREVHSGGAETQSAPLPAREIAQTDHRASAAGFASREKLIQHYQKHGWEFGRISLDEYLRIAQTLRDKPVGDNVLEFMRHDGTTSRFEKSTGTFVAFNPDMTIRTCFKPNDGIAYFERQKSRDRR